MEDFVEIVGRFEGECVKIVGDLREIWERKRKKRKKMKKIENFEFWGFVWRVLRRFEGDLFFKLVG